jgi:DNA-binding NarL/FixJ family response regulator
MQIVDIIDDQKMVAIALGNYIKSQEKKFIIGNIWHSAEEFILHLRNNKATPPNMVIVNHKLLGMGGWGSCYLLQKDFPEIKKMVLSSEASSKYANDFAKVGVMAFVSKTDDYIELSNAMYTVLSGNNYYNKYFTKKNKIDVIDLKKICFPANLSDYDFLFIHLCQTDYTYATMAAILGIKENNLHKKQQKVYKNLNVSTQGHLVAAAKNEGIIKVWEYLS